MNNIRYVQFYREKFSRTVYYDLKTHDLISCKDRIFIKDLSNYLAVFITLALGIGCDILFPKWLKTHDFILYVMAVLAVVLGLVIYFIRCHDNINRLESIGKIIPTRSYTEEQLNSGISVLQTQIFLISLNGVMVIVLFVLAMVFDVFTAAFMMILFGLHTGRMMADIHPVHRLRLYDELSGE